MLVFDSTLWHAAGQNVSGRDRLAINQQFTRSYVKQQVDYAARWATRRYSRRSRARSNFSAGTHEWSPRSTSTTRRRRNGSTEVARAHPSRRAESFAPEITVVSPVYGCAGCLTELHARLTAALESVTSSFELVFVDDRSPDGSWQSLTQLASATREFAWSG